MDRQLFQRNSRVTCVTTIHPERQREAMKRQQESDRDNEKYEKLAQICVMSYLFIVVSVFIPGIVYSIVKCVI
jgi:hypothetical protein